MYRNNSHLHIQEQRNARDIINKENLPNVLNKFLNKARQTNFSISDIFGKYVQIENSQPNYGRHIMPPRNTSCQQCEALVWPEEKRL